MKTLVIAPEPGFWLSQFKEDEDSVCFAPWATTHSWSFVPGPIKSFLSRRHLPSAVPIPGWLALEAACRVYAQGQTSRNIKARFAVRSWVDYLAARYVAKHKPQRVIAPSLSALRTFAAAKKVGAKCVLIEDILNLRQLHLDLDFAHSKHPDCGFLRNHRADRSFVVKQESEHVLTDQFFVRNQFSWDARLQSGTSESALQKLSPTPAKPLLKANSNDAILLPGLAAARHGACEMLKVLNSFPDLQLFITPGEGAEPLELLRHSRVHNYEGQPIAAVVAPYFCEANRTEIRAASLANIPIFTTDRAAGFENVTLVAPGNSKDIADKLRIDLGLMPC